MCWHPMNLASSSAASNSPGGAVGDEVVMATARSPNTIWATLRRNVESTPPEKATRSPLVPLSISFNPSNFASIAARQRCLC